MLWQQIVSGLAMGSIYAIVAVGFILIYKATEVINFAQGDLMMVGAFIAFTCINYLQIPFLAALGITLAFMFFFGVVIERLVLRPLVGEPAFAMVMVTIGLGILIRSVAGMIWGYDTYQFQAGITDHPVRIASLAVSSVHIWIIGVTLDSDNSPLSLLQSDQNGDLYGSHISESTGCFSYGYRSKRYIFTHLGYKRRGCSSGRYTFNPYSVF